MMGTENQYHQLNSYPELRSSFRCFATKGPTLVDAQGLVQVLQVPGLAHVGYFASFQKSSITALWQNFRE